jgi:hypothetical protein
MHFFVELAGAKVGRGRVNLAMTRELSFETD